MSNKQIIELAYSIILYKILNKVRRDDNFENDLYYCGTYTYEYYDNFIISYMPYDYVSVNEMRGAFYITFYKKYNTKEINEAIIHVHKEWIKDVENILNKCNKKWVIETKDCILNLENTIGLYDINNFLMKPINNYTFMTLFNIPNYYDYYRISQIIPRNIIDTFILNSHFYLKICDDNDNEISYISTINDYGIQKEYIFDKNFINIQNKKYIPKKHYFFNRNNSTDNDIINKSTMIKAYAYMVDKIVSGNINCINHISDDYTISFIPVKYKNKNDKKEFHIIMEFKKRFTFDIINESMIFVHKILENDINDYLKKNNNINNIKNNNKKQISLLKILNACDELSIMKPIHNRMILSRIIVEDNKVNLFYTKKLKEIYKSKNEILINNIPINHSSIITIDILLPNDYYAYIKHINHINDKIIEF